MKRAAGPRRMFTIDMGFLALIAALFAIGAIGDQRVTPTDARTPGLPRSPRFKVPRDALFAEDFSKSGLERWTADRSGVWSVERGVLRAQLPDEKQQRSILRTGDPGWTDYTVDLDVCMTRGVDKGVAVRVQDDEGLGADLRGPDYHDVLLHRGLKQLGKADAPNANGRWHHLRVEVAGRRCRVYVNGRQMIEAEDAKPSSGGIALAAYTGGVGKCTVYYDNVVVRRLARGKPSS